MKNGMKWNNISDKLKTSKRKKKCLLKLANYDNGTVGKTEKFNISRFRIYDN